MQRNIVLALTLMLSGRAMTLAFIWRAGDGAAGDPPASWLMPLIGDAARGLSALVVAYLMWTRSTPWVWVTAIVWNAIGAFDALAAFIVETTAPWPEFFMLEVFGRSMFLVAAGTRLAIIALLSGRALPSHFGLINTTTPRLRQA